ncbi:MAG: class I SAM-dependent methyltransferase [Euzebyales bacterium]|nr:class I SAM-dependent methyltransferase [Euzebyales bacterium]
MSHRIAGSFRDPSGFVFREDGVVKRQVNPGFRSEFDALANSGLYDELVGAGLLVSHQVEREDADGTVVIVPRQVPFVSYPYEWSAGQLRAAALVTLRAQRAALERGMTLRDASAFNVQFVDGRPLLIDTLSFGPLEEGMPWVGYRQFCQHFLAPLALMTLVDVRLGQLSRHHLDGVPLDLASTLLPQRTRVVPSLAMHIHAHARSQRRYAHDPDAPTARAKGRFSMNAFRGLVDSLESAVAKLERDVPESTWVDYYDGDSYTDESFEHKSKLVAAFLADVEPAQVWDLGANTGHFSRIAASQGAQVVAFDVDASAVEAHYRALRGERSAILPLVMDLTNPSPGLGWEHTERESLTARGPVDLALALALVHHLAIGDNVPLRRVADWFAALASALVIEFVGKSDPKVRRLLATRDDVFDDYDVEGFEAAFAGRFDTLRREPVHGSERVLYLMRRR